MNPYLVDSPALISLSGGRTSGYMLWCILNAFGGKLPAGVYVVFADTGLERRETHDFLGEMERRWGFKLNRIRRPHEGYATPFDALLEAPVRRKKDGVVAPRDYLPGPGLRFCTQELKVRVMKKWMTRTLLDPLLAAGVPKRKALAEVHWDAVMGIRADEPSRVARLRQSPPERGEHVMPLADAGVTEVDVIKFWRRQPFDLQLERHEGNCDLCLLKSDEKLIALMRKNPSWADFWVRHEARVGKQFRPKNKSYTVLLAEALRRNAANDPTPTEDELNGSLDLGDCVVCSA